MTRKLSGDLKRFRLALAAFLAYERDDLDGVKATLSDLYEECDGKGEIFTALLAVPHMLFHHFGAVDEAVEVAQEIVSRFAVAEGNARGNLVWDEAAQTYRAERNGA